MFREKTILSGVALAALAITALNVVLAVAALNAASAPDKEGMHLRFSLGDQTYTVTVSGKVTDARTKKPIADAEVRGHIVVWRYQGPEFFDKCPVQETHANAEGRYKLTFKTPLTITGPMAGEDSICISFGAPGYGTFPLYVRQKVTAETTEFKDVDVALEPGKLVRGVVVDEDNQPIGDATVKVQNNWNGDWQYFGSLGMATTNQAGEFEIWYSTNRDQVLGSKPYLSVFKKDYGLGLFWDFVDRDSMGRLAIPRGGTIIGKVVDTAGKAVPGREVTARFGAMIGLAGSVTTDQDGAYRLTGMPAREVLEKFSRWHSPGREPYSTVTVYVRTDPGGDLKHAPRYERSTKGGQTTTGPELVIGAEASVAGRLLPSKNPFALKGLTVRLDYDWDTMVEADAEGRFSFPNIPHGKHRLTAYLPNNLRGDRGIGHAEITVEKAKPLENVEIQLETLAEVRVQFFDQKGAPLPGITAGATWSRDGSGFWTEGTKSDADGRAVVYLYGGDTQYVRGFSFNPAGKLVSEGAQEVKPKAGEVIENIRIVMVPTASLHGRLLDEANQPIKAERLLAKLAYADGTETRRPLKADSSGEYKLEDLAPGIIGLSVETLPLELEGKTPDRIELKPGETKQVDLVMKKVKFHGVAGKLLSSPTFADLSGFKIRLDLEEWEPMLDTDAEGRFSLTKVRPGKHRLTAYLPFNLRTDMGVGHVNIEVTDADIEDVQLPLDELATVHMRITDADGGPLEGISAAAWWTKDHSGVFTEGTKSDKDGKATLYLYPDDLQYVGAHDWSQKYQLKEDRQMKLKAGEVVKDFTVIMLPGPEKPPQQ